MGIPFEELVEGTVYRLKSRNLIVGVFTGRDGFIGIRFKFGCRYLSNEIEYTRSEHYGTATAQEVLGKIPTHIPLTESLGTVCNNCKQPVNWSEDRPVNHRWLHDDGSLTCANAWPVSVPNDELFAELQRFEEALS